MALWKRQEQETDGLYFFSGRFYVTRRVFEEIDPHETAWMIEDVRKAAKAENGLDYLQVYRSDDNRSIWIIDSLNSVMKSSGSYTPSQIKEHDYFTLMFPSEY